MGGVLIASLRVRAEAITEWDIALLAVIVGIMIAVGLIRAWSLHLRTQIVIHDVEPDEGVPAETAAQLSLQLRQAVRGILRRQSDDARLAEMETLEQDIKDGLMTIHGVITMNATIEQLDRTTQDSMSAILAGLRAVGPKESEGLAVALQLAIPAQRGWSVRAFPTSRGTGIRARVGLSIEIARLGHAPEVVTTFWTTSSALQQQQASEAARLTVIGELLHELMQPASVWIAIRLVSHHLTQMRSWYYSLLPIRHRRQRELAGLQAQLAGQMLLYATRTQQKYVRGFADEALRNLEQAAHLLPQYLPSVLDQGGRV
ncbi:MAG: hypothetical protein ACXWPI_13425 [Ktedonobacterales bacterium]